MILEKIKQVEATRLEQFKTKHMAEYMEHIRLIMTTGYEDARKMELIASYLEVSYLRGCTDGFATYTDIDRLFDVKGGKA